MERGAAARDVDHIPSAKVDDGPPNPPGVYCNGGCGWGRGIMPSVTLACLHHGRIEQGVDYLQRQAAAAQSRLISRVLVLEYAGASKPGGAPWYCETSAGFLDALHHGVFGLSTPERCYRSLRLTPLLSPQWNEASCELRVPNGSRITATFFQDQHGMRGNLKSTPPLPVKLVLPWDDQFEPHR